ncbi:hypothetical protein SAMN03159448_01798 [Sinorhizobium sp. NFACC03]|nr:hypothetical protein SAMN03159448_01798 [Sinorhizobium sp. NFACC03]
MMKVVQSTDVWPTARSMATNAARNGPILFSSKSVPLLAVDYQPLGRFGRTPYACRAVHAELGFK